MVVLVIVIFLCILCFGYNIISLFNKLSDFISKLLWSNITRDAKSKIDGQSYFSSMHKYKRYLTSTHINLCIDYQLNIWQFGNPSIMIQQECIWDPLECSILAFSKSITLWMVSNRKKVFYTQGFLKQFPELCYKMWVSVAYNYVRYSKISYSIFKEQLHCLSCG